VHFSSSRRGHLSQVPPQNAHFPSFFSLAMKSRIALAFLDVLAFRPWLSDFSWAALTPTASFFSARLVCSALSCSLEILRSTAFVGFSSLRNFVRSLSSRTPRDYPHDEQAVRGDAGEVCLAAQGLELGHKLRHGLLGLLALLEEIHSSHQHRVDVEEFVLEHL
jgi:hypothetical protein